MSSNNDDNFDELANKMNAQKEKEQQEADQFFLKTFSMLDEENPQNKDDKLETEEIKKSLAELEAEDKHKSSNQGNASNLNPNVDPSQVNILGQNMADNAPVSESKKISENNNACNLPTEEEVLSHISSQNSMANTANTVNSFVPPTIKYSHLPVVNEFPAANSDFQAPMERRASQPLPQGNFDYNSISNPNPQEAKAVGILKKTEAKLADAEAALKKLDLATCDNNVKVILRVLDGLKSTVANYPSAFQFNMLIEKLLKRVRKLNSSLTLFKYRYLSAKFRSINYVNGQNLSDFARKFMVTPFFNFDDVFDPQKNYENLFMSFWGGASSKRNRFVLLYGPKGSGKTLLVHALARKVQAKLVQLEDLRFFNIPFFGKEIHKLLESFKEPFILYIKNIEQLVSVSNQIEYFIENLTVMKTPCLLMCSTQYYPTFFLPKFQAYFYNKSLICCGNNAVKPHFVKFLYDKMGVKYTGEPSQLQQLLCSVPYCYNYEDLFKAVKETVDYQKNKLLIEDMNDMALTFDDFALVLKSLPGSIDPQAAKAYNL